MILEKEELENLLGAKDFDVSELQKKITQLEDTLNSSVINNNDKLESLVASLAEKDYLIKSLEEVIKCLSINNVECQSSVREVIGSREGNF